jgi:hypothetical protein
MVDHDQWVVFEVREEWPLDDVVIEVSSEDGGYDGGNGGLTEATADM